MVVEVPTRAGHEYTLREHRLGRADLRRLRDRPHEVLREVADQGGDVVTLRVGPLRAFLAVHPDAAKHVLQDQWRNYNRNTFQYRLLRGVSGEGLLSLDGPDWLARRRTAAPAFRRDGIQDYARTMKGAAERVSVRWTAAAQNGDAVDVLHEMSRFALDVLGTTLLGPAVGGAAGRDGLVHATEIVLEHVMAQSRTLGLVPGWLPTARSRRFRAAKSHLDEAVYEAIRTARAGKGGGDLLAALLDPDAKPALSDRQLRDELVTFLIAGHETVASALSWTWHLLATDPDVGERVRGSARESQNPMDSTDATAFLRATFQETLRLYPPAWVTTRRAAGADQICGQPVPKGSLVIVSPYATQRQSRLWADPDRFDPNRFVGSTAHHRYAHFPFGGGPHLCVGNHFALLEATILLQTLADRFRLEPVQESVVAEPGVTLRPHGGLWMRPVPI